jgi:hypothetical protein
MSDNKGIGIASLAAGAVLTYGGIKGYSILKAAQNLIQGKPVNNGQTTSLLSSGGGGSSPGTGGNPSPKGSYDHASLMKLWTSVGGSSSGANNAACHAMQESSGDPKVTSSNPDGGINVGLWQLDTKGKGAGHTVAQLQDPVTNARITVSATNNGNDWSAWATPGC